MVRGTAVDRLVFGGDLVRCDVDRSSKVWAAIALMATGVDVAIYGGAVRNGKEWEAFRDANLGRYHVLDKEWQAAYDLLKGRVVDVGTIVSGEVYEDARRAAEKVIGDPDAGPLVLRAKHQVPVQWDMHGLPWATRGIDALGAEYGADLKSTACTERVAFSHQARRMRWVEQLATYAAAAPRRDWYLIGVEAKAPFNVTVLRPSADDMREADLEVELWCARIKRCEESGVWGGYASGIQDMEPRSAWEMAGEVE
jgi:hypothetical protein